jgi:hypothetical protein
VTLNCDELHLEEFADPVSFAVATPVASANTDTNEQTIRSVK